MSDTYQYDFSNLGTETGTRTEYPIVADGEYEVTIEKAEKTTFTNSNGITTKQIALRYRIRKDVEQPFQGQIIFDHIGEDNIDKGAYDKIRLNRILGYGFDHTDPEIHNAIAAIKTSDMIIQFLVGMNFRVQTVMPRNDDNSYRGKNPNIVKYMPTKHGQTVVKEAPKPAPQAAKAPAVGTNDDDLPF